MQEILFVVLQIKQLWKKCTLTITPEIVSEWKKKFYNSKKELSTVPCFQKVLMKFKHYLNVQAAITYLKTTIKRGPWGFGKIRLRGVLGAVRKSTGVPFLCFIAFLWPNFSELTPSPPPDSVYLCSNLYSNGVRCSYVH
jgi:hypothetical protein